MKQRRIAGTLVGELGLGCMGMSQSYGPSDENESLRVLDRAIELGCNFWDTADVYGAGKNELLLAKALKKRRGKVFLATKVGNVRDRTLTEADVALFIGVTWEVYPLQTDQVYASASSFKRRIVPGLLTASLLTHLGGLWAFLATDMKFKYLAPVYIGESITAEAEVVEINPQNGAVRLRCRCFNQHGKDVLQADVSGFPGKFA